MNSTLSKILIFAAGAAVGAGVTYKLVERKFAQQAREEVEAVRELYQEKESDDDESEPEPEAIIDGDHIATGRIPAKPSIQEYAEKLKAEGYVNYSDAQNDEPEKEEVPVMKYEPPYVLNPSEFGNNEEYETQTLYYFADEVLTDDDYNMIEDVEGMVGDEALNTFGDYEDDAVYVRNERYKTDYEILLDERKFSNVPKSKPYSVEV